MVNKFDKTKPFRSVPFHSLNEEMRWMVMTKVRYMRHSLNPIQMQKETSALAEEGMELIDCVWIQWIVLYI